jgi:hypothetical protein
VTEDRLFSRIFEPKAEDVRVVGKHCVVKIFIVSTYHTIL